MQAKSHDNLEKQGLGLSHKEDNFLERGGHLPRVILVTDQAHNSHRLGSSPLPDHLSLSWTQKGVHDETRQLSLQSLALPVMLTKLSISDSSWQHDKNTRAALGPESLDLWGLTCSCSAVRKMNLTSRGTWTSESGSKTQPRKLNSVVSKNLHHYEHR